MSGLCQRCVLHIDLFVFTHVTFSLYFVVFCLITYPPTVPALCVSYYNKLLKTGGETKDDGFSTCKVLISIVLDPLDISTFKGLQKHEVIWELELERMCNHFF